MVIFRGLTSVNLNWDKSSDTKCKKQTKKMQKNANERLFFTKSEKANGNGSKFYVPIKSV